MALRFPPSRTVTFVFGGSARPSILAVTYRNSITRTLLLLCLLLSLLVLVWVTLSGTGARRRDTVRTGARRSRRWSRTSSTTPSSPPGPPGNPRISSRLA